jgi:cytochrome c553
MRTRMMKKKLLLIVSAFIACSLAYGAPIATGEKLVELKGCVTCHGKDGNGTDPTYPTLAGQYASYLVHSMKAYQTGERKHDLMKGYVKDLTDAELAELARHFAAQKSKLHDLSAVK